MLFVIDKPRLQRLIAVTRDERSPREQGEAGPFFRIEASGQSLTLSGRAVEVSIAATVHEPGMAFLRVTLFRRMLAALPGVQFKDAGGYLTIQINEHGLLVGDARLSPDAIDMLIYPDPATAPKLHPSERVGPDSVESTNPEPTLFDLGEDGGT